MRYQRMLRFLFFIIEMKNSPFVIKAIVILPDHLHTIWHLPEKDMDYSSRWRNIKGYFSRSLPKTEVCNKSRIKKNERAIWQRRFWEHTIRDEKDFQRHFDYVHYNPVKHGLVQRVCDWPYSTFHRLARSGIYPIDWAGGMEDKRRGLTDGKHAEFTYE